MQYKNNKSDMIQFLKLTSLMFLECKHEAGCIRSGHLLPERNRPNFNALILKDLSPDLSAFRHKKSWGNSSHIHTTDFHIFIIICAWFSTSPTFFFYIRSAAAFEHMQCGTKLKNQVSCCCTSMA